MEEFTNSTIANEQTLSLSKKVVVKTNSSLDKMYPQAWPSKVTITTNNGEEISEQVNYPSGDPESNVTKIQIFQKFLSMANPLIEGNGQLIIDKIFDEELTPDIIEMIELSIPSSTKQLSA